MLFLSMIIWCRHIAASFSSCAKWFSSESRSSRWVGDTPTYHHDCLFLFYGKFSLRVYQIGQTYAKDEYQHYYVTIHLQTVDIHSQNATIHSQNAKNAHFKKFSKKTAICERKIFPYIIPYIDQYLQSRKNDRKCCFFCSKCCYFFSNCYYFFSLCK